MAMNPMGINLQRRYFSIKTQYDGLCKACDVPLYRGEQAIWDSQDRKLFCTECGTELMEEEE